MATAVRKTQMSGRWISSLRSAADTQPDYLIEHVLGLMHEHEKARNVESANKKQSQKRKREKAQAKKALAAGE